MDREDESVDMNRLKSVRRVLVFTAHADDCEFFGGGLVSLLAANGAEVTEVIATDNGRGSFEMDQTELVRQSREVEAMAAARIVGKKYVEFLGYSDGFLNETPLNELRRIFIEWIRRVRPDCVISFDMFAGFETHPDHIHVARAATEAVGFAHLPLYHPEQIKGNLQPHLTPLCAWFSKSHDQDNFTVDIGDVIQTKIDSILAHESQMRLTMTEAVKNLQAGGRFTELISFFDADNPRPAIDAVIRAWATDAAQDESFEYGEGFRFEMADDMFEGFLPVADD